MSPRPLLFALACVALAAAGCGSSAYRLVIQVSPPEASVFVNGKRLATGTSRLVHDFSFDSYGRAFVQVTAPNYEPSLDVLTEEDVRRLYDQELPYSKALRQRIR